MNLRGLFWVYTAVALPRTLSAGATIEGQVELPKPSSAVVVNQRYEVVTKAGAITTSPPLAVVYLEGSFPKTPAPPTKVILQKNLTFEPLLLPVQVGTKIEFPNLDDTYHNVFSYSPAKRFDLGRYRRNEKPVPTQIFDRPGLVTLRCDIHEHMRGLILVVPTPYFVLSDTDGRYRLTGLPAGHYTLKAWLTSKSTLERPVNLKDGATVHVNFP
ncbi:MAG TPA: carboxypeptidase regulatory-like domain-containing protein [Chthoniobacterales bacterium]|nr:carboxypeptidase regulatory-like domain-containing protein [Chthoniobacterales bacterium]